MAIEEGYKHADVLLKEDILNKLFGCITLIRRIIKYCKYKNSVYSFLVSLVQ